MHMATPSQVIRSLLYVLAAICVSASAVAAPGKGASPEDAKLAECSKKNAETTKSIHARLDNARKKGNVNREEEAQYKRAELDHIALHVKLSKGGISLAECESLTKSLTQLSALVHQIDSTVREWTECETRNRELVQRTARVFSDAKSAGKIGAKEEEHYKRLKDDSAKNAAKLHADGVHIADCHAMTKGYEYIQAEVKKMAADPAR